MSIELRALQAGIGMGGRKRIGEGETVEGKFTGVLALDGDFTYDEGCEVKRGDAPQEDDVVEAGTFDLVPLTKVVCKTGDGYVYMLGTKGVW